MIEGSNVIIEKRLNPISSIPEMTFGSMPNDGGNLLISEIEYQQASISSNLELRKYILPAISAKEFINGKQRYCIWIKDIDVKEAIKIPFIQMRIERVKKHREISKREATNKLASTPHKFGEIRHANTELIIIPRHSSERREYIPFGYLNKGNVALDSSLAIYSAKPWILGMLNSRIHMAWVRSVAGRIKTDYRYSSSVCYNTFPFPNISDSKKKRFRKVCI